MSNLLDLNAIRRDNPLPDIVAGAGVALKRKGNELVGCCPLHSDRSPSFTIFDNGRRYQCFGCGACGDVLDFVQALHGVGLRDAAKLLGAGELPAVSLPALPIDDALDRTEEALAIWNAAEQISGTLAETYLRWRHLHLRLPECLRFAALRYGKSGPEHPVMVAQIVASDGSFMGIQRTYLAPDGKGKASVPKPKLSLGKVSGGAVRLAPVSASLIVTEGIEDALTLQQELGLATWAAAGSTMLPNMRFPAEVASVAVGGDADDAGRSAARKAATAFANRGLHASTFFPTVGKDFNAELAEVRA